MYMTRYTEPEAVGYLVAEYVSCGKRGCRCGRGERHGPYWYLHYRRFENGRWRGRKRYVPAEYHAAVGRWLKQNKLRDRTERVLLQDARRLRVAAKATVRGDMTDTELTRVCTEIQGNMENDGR